MSKKLQNALQTFAADIYDRKSGMVFDSTTVKIVEDFEERMVDERSGKLLNFLSTELDKVYIQIGSQLNKYETKILEINRAGREVDEETMHERDLLLIQKKIIERTIERKKEARRNRGDSPLIRKHVEYPVVLVDKPKAKTLTKMRTETGLILENRDGGYRQLYFKNENGTLLTEYDSRVLIALGKICMDKGMKQEFTVEIREIAEAMRLPMPGGGDYENIRRSLEEIYNTSIVFEESMDENFVDLMSVDYNRILQRMKKIGRNFNSALITLQDYFYKALLTGDVVMINMYLLNDLSLNVSKSLYKFILNEFKTPRDVYVYEFETLRKHLGYGSDNAPRAYQTLKKAFQQMVEFEVIEDFRDERIERGNYLFYIKPNPIQVAYATQRISNALPDGSDVTFISDFSQGLKQIEATNGN